MASAAPEPVRGTVDAAGRLTAADPRLARLQEEAGGGLGAMLAVPQLAAIARLASQLGVSLSRQALAATSEADLDLWVRAEPSSAGVALSIESWVEKPPRRRRFRLIEGTESGNTDPQPDLTTDANLRLLSVSAEAAEQLELAAASARGEPLARVLELLPGTDGDLPLLSAVAGRQPFEGQLVRARSGTGELVLGGEPRMSPEGDFAGFDLRLTASAKPDEAVSEPAEDFDDLLRQPLDVIMGEAARIAEKGEGPLRSDYAGYAADIAAAARHLLDVLQSMSVERAAPSAERIDLAALALEATGLVQAQASEAGVTFDVDGPTALQALGEARSVTQILVNLIGNAVRHSPRGKVVHVTGAAGAHVSITVADEGPGIAAADQQRIFERFEQAEPRADGAGLGLAISRRLARQMGGDITLESTPGEGARFTLRLPGA
jgi:signal transduction histidine kinase